MFEIKNPNFITTNPLNVHNNGVLNNSTYSIYL